MERRSVRDPDTTVTWSSITPERADANRDRERPGARFVKQSNTYSNSNDREHSPLVPNILLFLSHADVELEKEEGGEMLCGGRVGLGCRDVGQRRLVKLESGDGVGGCLSPAGSGGERVMGRKNIRSRGRSQ